MKWSRLALSKAACRAITTISLAGSVVALSAIPFQLMADGATNLSTVQVTANVCSSSGASIWAGDRLIGCMVPNDAVLSPTAFGDSGGGSPHAPLNSMPTVEKGQNKNPNCYIGDPVDPATGYKVEKLNLFSIPGEMGLTYTLYYNASLVNTYSGNWTDNLAYGAGVYGNVGEFVRPDNSELDFTGSGNPMTFQPKGTATFKATATGYLVHDENSNVLTFDEYGELTSIMDPSGVGWTIIRNSEFPTTTTPRVTKVVHTNGQFFTITATATGQTTIVDPAGNIYTFNGSALSLPGSRTLTFAYSTHSGAKDIWHGLMTSESINGVPHDTTIYDSRGRVYMTSMEDGSEKYMFSYGSSASGPTTTITNPLGHTEVYQYNSNNLLTSITGNASANCEAYFASNTYDANGNLTSSKDNNGNLTKYTYAANGLLQQKIEASGTSVQRTTDYVWDSTPGTNRPLSITIEGLSKTVYAYDSHNRLASTTVSNLTGVGDIQPLTTTYAYTYQSNGMVATKKVTRPSANNADTTTYTYDAQGYLDVIADGLGHKKTFHNHTGLGQPTVVTNANGDVTNYGYDARGRVTSISHSHAGATNAGYVSYDANSGLPSLVVAFNNEQTRYTYDADFKVTKSVWTGPSGASITTAYTYDANRDVTGITKNLAGSSTPAVSEFSTYDELGRVIAVKGNHGQLTSIAYDLNGNVISTKDALGHATTVTYDALNRPIKVTDANGITTQAVYGVDDKIHQFTDSRGLNTTYSYDGFGNVWMLNSPDTGMTTYGYGGFGHLTSVIPATGVPVNYNYDAIYRVTSIAAGGETHSFTYDNCSNGIGMLCNESTPNTSSSYTYTPEGWLASRSDTSVIGTGTEDYAYDGMGRMIQATAPSAGITAVAYHWTDDQITSVTASLNGGAAQTVASNITYDVLRHPISWTYGNGLGHSQTYDSDGRLTGIATSSGVQAMGFTYDDANRLTNIANSVYSVQTQHYTYDNDDRLTNMTGAAALNLTYDASGNRISQSDPAGGTAIIAPSSNHLLSRGVHTYAYDARGNRIQDAVTGSILSYTYDGFGRLRTASRSASATVCETFNACPTYAAGTMTYFFSASGQRMSKTDPNGETAWYSYLPSGQLSSELSTTGGYNYYIYLGGQPIGVVHNPLVVNVDTLYFVHSDRMGRPESITDTAQNKQWTGLNYAFDSVAFYNGAVSGIDIGLPGQVHDNETNNWSNGFREYDSSNGRYLESDPTGLAGGMNTYVYADGDPVNLVDSMGLAPGDSFLSAQAAAIDALRYISLKPDWCKREYGGWIYKKWSLFGPPTYTYDEPLPLLNTTGGDLPDMPAWHETDAMFHNHPLLDGYDYNHFSFDDKDTAAADNLPSYLLIPNGTILRFAPGPGGDRDSGITTIVGHD